LAIRELKEPTITFWDDPKDSSILVKTTKWQRKYKHTHDQQKQWDKNTQKIYATFHTRDENQTAHDGLVGKNKRRLRWDHTSHNNL
jgi:hypothetical protein